MISVRTQSKIAFSFFILAALVGVLLRAFPVIDIPANYRHLVNTHSHITLLGWVYLALIILLSKSFITENGMGKRYPEIFWFTWATVIGMLITFPFQGYAPLSIFYSTAFLFASYWFTWFFIKQTPDSKKNAAAFPFVRTALWFMVLSSLGPWALGLIMNTVGSNSMWYRMAIYFFLHFQYNGWMTMALVGLLVFILQKHQINQNQLTQLYWLLTVGIILTFFLSTLWVNPGTSIYILGGLGACCQLVALAMLIYLCKTRRKKLASEFTEMQWRMLMVVLALLTMKMLLQLLTSFPYFAHLAAIILDFTIAYLHLTFLGVVSIAIFLFLDFFRVYTITKTGYQIYLLGFLTTETLIFYKGVSLWQQWPLFPGYFEALFGSSLLIPIGLTVMLLFGQKFAIDKEH